MSSTVVGSLPLSTDLSSAKTPIQSSAQSSDSAIISSIGDESNGSLGTEAVGSVNVGLKDVYKSLTVLADEIIEKLDELLSEQLPDGIASLKPEDHTPEKTAQRIVDGTTALFEVFRSQNPELEGEELVDNFMETIRGGIEQGYGQAVGTLDELGAFEFEGVMSGIEETMKIVEEKLSKFEAKLKEYFGEKEVEEEPSEQANESQENEAAEVAVTNQDAVVNQ